MLQGNRRSFLLAWRFSLVTTRSLAVAEVLLRLVCYTLSTHAEGEQAMQTTDLARAARIVIWNRRFMSVLGLWPTKVNEPLFVFFTVYVTVHCSMGVAHLIKYFSQPDHIVANLTENVLFLMILGKLIILRCSCGIMAEFLQLVEDDFSSESYCSVSEKAAYLHYNEIALIFIKVSMSLAAFSATLYYCRVFFENWAAIASGNFSYQLPYQVHPFFEIKDGTTYICICSYLLIALPLIVCAYSGPDAFVLGLALHICGQFAALSCKIDEALKDHKNYHCHISGIIMKHHRLITLAEILEDNFNMIFLQQTLGTVFLLCLTSYHMIANSEYGDSTSVITFLLYTCCVISTILAYCYIGECLITESAGLREAFYNTDWYNNPPPQSKLISICMIRSEKPLALSADSENIHGVLIYVAQFYVKSIKFEISAYISYSN